MGRNQLVLLIFESIRVFWLRKWVANIKFIRSTMNINLRNLHMTFFFFLFSYFWFKILIIIVKNFVSNVAYMNNNVCINNHMTFVLMRLKVKQLTLLKNTISNSDKDILIFEFKENDVFGLTYDYVFHDKLTQMHKIICITLD